MSLEWTEPRVENLKKMWADGLSASQIASELSGVTRNAVIGKIHRLGLGGRVKVGSRSPRIRRQKDRFVQAKQRSPSRFRLSEEELETQALPPDDVTPPTAIAITELKERTCRWPYGDSQKGEVVMYCGNATFEEHPYCKAHCCRAYTVQERRIPSRPFYR